MCGIAAGHTDDSEMRDALRKERKKMYGYEAAVVMMVGKAMDAKRERILSQERQTRRPRRSK